MHVATRTRSLRCRAWTTERSSQRQIGRRPRAFRRVAARCPFGLPAVTEQEPTTTHGAPFPTTYYLTCRHLIAAVSRLEAAGGVERWSAAVARDPALAADLARRDRRAAAASDMRSQAGGRARTTVPRSTPASAARGIPRSSSASMRTSRSLSPSPGYRVGGSSSPRCPSAWPGGALLRDPEPHAA